MLRVVSALSGLRLLDLWTATLMGAWFGLSS
jgi:hypothetical protein